LGGHPAVSDRGSSQRPESVLIPLRTEGVGQHRYRGDCRILGLPGERCEWRLSPRSAPLGTLYEPEGLMIYVRSGVPMARFPKAEKRLLIKMIGKYHYRHSKY